MFNVIASFTDENGAPLTGSDYSVVVMDEDKYFDDKLDAKPPKGLTKAFGSFAVPIS